MVVFGGMSVEDDLADLWILTPECTQYTTIECVCRYSTYSVICALDHVLPYIVLYVITSSITVLYSRSD